MSGGKHALLSPVCAVDDDEIAGGGRGQESSPVRVPGDLGARLRLPGERFDDAVNLLDQRGLLAAQRVDVHGAVGARDGQVVAGRVERHVFSRVGLGTQSQDLAVVGEADDFNGGLVAGHGYPVPVRREGDVSRRQRGTYEELRKSVCGH